MQRHAATLLNLPTNFASPGLQLTQEWLTNFCSFNFIPEITKVTDRLRTGLSTAGKTGSVLPADPPFLHRVGTNGVTNAKLEYNSDDSHAKLENSTNTPSRRPRANTMLGLNDNFKNKLGFLNRRLHMSS
eukprot:4459870-Pleurochrysis_carterae.AAC.1